MASVTSAGVSMLGNTERISAIWSMPMSKGRSLRSTSPSVNMTSREPSGNGTVLATRSVEARPIIGAFGVVESSDLSARELDYGWRVAGGGVGERLGVGVHDDEGRRSEEQSSPLTQDVRHFAEDVGDRDARVEQRRDHAAKECHVGGRGEAVSGDVADDESQSLIAEQDPLIPVTSHRCRLAGGKVPGGGFDPRHDREYPEQTRGEVDDELVVSVMALRPLDRRRAQLGNGMSALCNLMSNLTGLAQAKPIAPTRLPLSRYSGNDAVAWTPAATVSARISGNRSR